MKQHQFRSLEITELKSWSKTTTTYLFNDDGLLLKYSYVDYDPRSNKLRRNYFYRYEFDNNMLLTKEECKDAKDSLLFNHIYKWSFLSPNVLEVRQIGYRHEFGDGSPDTNIKVISDNSITITLDSNKHVLNCLSVNHIQNFKDTIQETCSYDSIGQIERVSLSDNLGGRGWSPYYLFKHNEKGKVIEIIGASMNDVNNPYGKRITNRTIRDFDDQNRLIKMISKYGSEQHLDETYTYEYDKQGRMISSTGEGSPYYDSETNDYYDNGLIKKRVRKWLAIDMRSKTPRHIETETSFYKYK